MTGRLFLSQRLEQGLVGVGRREVAIDPVEHRQGGVASATSLLTVGPILRDD